MKTKNKLTIYLVIGECELYGAKAVLEAHHINKLKNLKQRWKDRKEIGIMDDCL